MDYIYVLNCQNNKYYIGKTKNINLEFKNHMDGKSQRFSFTKKNKPYNIEALFNQTDDFDMYSIVAKYIIKYGRENIGFDSIRKLDKLDKFIKKTNLSCCCGAKNHWLVNCNNNIKYKFWDDFLSSIFEKLEACFNRNYTCIRCGYFGHTLLECSAIKHIDGSDLEMNEITFNNI